MKDINVIKDYIKNAEALGGTKQDGIRDAAKHFGVTYNAVHCRLWKYEHGINLSGLKNKKTTKVPLKRKKAKRFNQDLIVPEPTGYTRSITMKIKDVRIDMEKGTITISY